MRAFLLLLLASAGAAACDTLDRRSSATLRAEMTRLQAEIDRISQPPTATRPASCRVVAYGSKPCGGPWHYVIVSTEVTDTTALAVLTGRFTTLEREANVRDGLFSDCMVMPVPPVTLKGGMCVPGR